jgi:hypothetical protein
VVEVPASFRPRNAKEKGSAPDLRQRRHAQAFKGGESLEKHPRFHRHFTPTWASWLDMVERFFRSITTDRLELGVFRSVSELIAAIEEHIALHHRNPKPFVWMAMANHILQKVIRANRRPGSKNNEAPH